MCKGVVSIVVIAQEGDEEDKHEWGHCSVAATSAPFCGYLQNIIIVTESHRAAHTGGDLERSSGPTFCGKGNPNNIFWHPVPIMS